MGKKTTILCGAITLLSVFFSDTVINASPDGQESGQKAQEEKAPAAKAAPMAPIVFEGDDISYDEATGNVYAKGNVKITQEAAKITSDEMKGNTQTFDVWVDGKAHITQTVKPRLDLNGYNSYYNYQKREGTMEKMAGRADEQFIKGEKIEFFPDEIIVYNGTTTKCPAKKPDYHMSASKIEIWPNQKMIAYNAKFWIKDTILYSTKRYETKIGDNASDNAFPKIGYNSDDGVYVKQKFEHAFNDTLSAFADIGYYSKHDFKNDYGLVWRQPSYYVVAETGDFQDDDGNWIKKEPNFRFVYPTKKIGSTPYNYRFDAEYGKWSDAYKTSWHQDYELYFSRDAIKLTDSLKLYLGAGYQIVKESYNGMSIDTFKYDATLYQTLTPKISVWTGYHYTKNDIASTLFNYDVADVGKELASGISYRFDDKNTLVIAQSYDLERSRTADMDYTWYRNLHCWKASLTYREKRDEWKFKVDVAHW